MHGRGGIHGGFAGSALLFDGNHPLARIFVDRMSRRWPRPRIQLRALAHQSDCRSGPVTRSRATCRNSQGSAMWLIVHFIIITGVSIRVLLRPHRDPASRVAWILFIAAVPYLGALLYLMLGEVRSAQTAGLHRQIPVDHSCGYSEMECAISTSQQCHGYSWSRVMSAVRNLRLVISCSFLMSSSQTW